MSKIYSPSTPCWVSEYSTDTQGYAMKRINGSLKGLHRVIYEALHGSIADWLELDHLCRNRACVNPHHLEIVTHRENVLRGVSPSAKASAQTHCSRNHPLSGENIYTSPSLKGRRVCKTCNQARSRVYMEKKRRSKGIPPRKNGGYKRATHILA